MMKIVTVIGARPQFIKAAPISRQIRNNYTEVLVHTGQHYDDNMSKIFFDELDIPQPDYNLNVGSATHGKQTGEMLAKIEEVLLAERPDLVIVYGDTNSTLAGALAASKLLIPVAHIEAGLRSFNMNMPEEQNRVLTDHISKILFCPTETAVKNLKNEGITKNVCNVGDVMYDALLFNLQIAEKKSNIIKDLKLNNKGYILATIHRAENTDYQDKLSNIIKALNSTQEKIVFPVHPRTMKIIKQYGLKLNNNILAVDPVGYLDMLLLEKNAKKIVTDSGGVQKEAYFLGVPCITLREETEWVETLEGGWNILVGSDSSKIVNSITSHNPNGEKNNHFGDGNASFKIVDILSKR